MCSLFDFPFCAARFSDLSSCALRARSRWWIFGRRRCTILFLIPARLNSPLCRSGTAFCSLVRAHRGTQLPLKESVPCPARLSSFYDHGCAIISGAWRRRVEEEEVIATKRQPSECQGRCIPASRHHSKYSRKTT